MWMRYEHYYGEHAVQGLIGDDGGQVLVAVFDVLEEVLCLLIELAEAVSLVW
jgi:hypothetical protein